MSALGQQPKAVDINESMVNKGMHMVTCIAKYEHLSASGG